ncbi:hydrogenase maturation nickel metallochaperone HypA [Actinophytocola sp.]|jgi:hydrogenase nickel incorporation protein HypA/HybF|uniref:hydrogenase maturation nickel metallochaperone HypA n=1 Tax=Actinophytocola sp. TaxID=1872138 RepID=UPI002ED7B4A6
MHEMSITQSIVDAVAEKLGDAEVTAVRLEVGKLSGVVVDSIRFCFDLVTEGTTLQGARLVVDEPAGQARCRECATEFEVADPIVLCPACDGSNVDVRSGRDLRIVSVEVNAACARPVAAPTTPASG